MESLFLAVLIEMLREQKHLFDRLEKLEEESQGRA
jgi:hypothetical protein